MGDLHDIAEWRARRRARNDVPMGAPPFVLEEPCPGCGGRRVATMVWRQSDEDLPRIALPRIAPHFLCHEGEVLWQDITDSGISVSEWTRILGHFEPADRALPE